MVSSFSAARMLPGKAQSLWTGTVADTDYPPLMEPVTVDVAIVGGGFVGIASAVSLKEAGLKVAVVESRRILRGVTGHTTAKVTSLHGLIYHHLVSTFGKERARQYAEANQWAIEKIASTITGRDIACDFSRQPFYTFAETDGYLKQIEDEVKAAQGLGLPTTFEKTIPVPLKIKGAIRFDNQAQFHPLKYLHVLATTIPGDGSYIFEKTRAVNIEDAEPCIVTTNKGKIRARSVIVATNFPIHDKPGLYFSRLNPVRSYVLGIRVKEKFPGGMFIGAEETGNSFRSQPDEQGEIVVVGGGNHKTGHGGDTARFYRQIEANLHRLYDQLEVEYRWSTQDPYTIDRVPYIGRMTPVNKHLFVATGFGQWGMTHSVVAANILTDLIQDKKNPWADIYNPSRFNPNTSMARNLVSENFHILRDYAADLVSSPEIDAEQIERGEGGIARYKGKRAAVARDNDGNLYTLDRTCPHLKCFVRWNNAEASWDCPCHGSRYTFDGEVINSPTVKSLKKLK